MMGLLKQAVGYTAVATVLALLFIVGWLAQHGYLSAERRTKLLMVMQGMQLPEERSKPDELAAEQPSLEDVARVRARQTRQLELREESLRRGMERWRVELARVGEERDRLEQTRKSFAEELKAVREQSEATGAQNARSTIERSKPRDAKRLLREMLDKGEVDAVVGILNAVPAATRVKICAEFKSPEETALLDELLRRMRQGVPEKPVADKALEQVQPNAEVSDENNAGPSTRIASPGPP